MQIMTGATCYKYDYVMLYIVGCSKDICIYTHHTGKDGCPVHNWAYSTHRASNGKRIINNGKPYCRIRICYILSSKIEPDVQ